MNEQMLRRILWLLCILFGLTACQEKAEIIEVIRPIKTITVKDQPSAQILKYSGLVAAVDSSGLSFEVGGQVKIVNVDIGDVVKKDDVLAELDPEPFQLEVAAIKAELIKAKDNVDKTKSEYDRQKRIFEQGAGAERFVEVAEYDYKAAGSAVKFQLAKLDLARRDLRKTKLLAPYDGTIAWRAVQPNEKVPPGKKVLEINASGELEVQLAVPETTVDLLNIDDSVTIGFPTLPGRYVAGRISFIGSAAVKANAFPVKVLLVEPDKGVKPGMTAEASLRIDSEDRTSGYLVPIQALLSSPEPNRGYAFVYDPKTSTVKRTAVRFAGSEAKRTIVSEGLAAGDIIAVAGVSFLADGMEVKLMEGDQK